MSKHPGEFELIARFFTRAPSRAVLGVGDDAALLAPTPGMQCAVTADMLVEGRHFFAGTDPEALGHKALAVNLSDLAAMGARPTALLLALALPESDSDWLAAFSRGLFALAEARDVELVGGDTTRGPRTISITAIGEVPPGQALRRDAARAGDAVWVSGSPGDARLALGHLRGEWRLPEFDSALRARLERPTPRVALGLALRGVANAAIDVSDGLLGDLGHVLRASGVGAELQVDAIPTSAALAAQPTLRRRTCQLAGGDDYELLFTAPQSAHGAVLRAAAAAATPVARIGSITAAAGLRLLDATGNAWPDADVDALGGFDHFRSR